MKNTGVYQFERHRKSIYKYTTLVSSIGVRLKMCGNDLETMMASESSADWTKILEMFIGKVHAGTKTQHYVVDCCKACLFALYVPFFHLF